MKVQDLAHFHNDGFGWVCKTCEAKIANKKTEKSRLMTEGEAESKQPVYSNKAMAKWTDSKQNTLICPNCGIIEALRK